MTTTIKRPLAVSGVALIIAISGLFDFLVGARIAFTPVAPTRRALPQILGENATVPDWFLLVNGALSLLLGLMYLWLVRLILTRVAISQVLIPTLAVVNIAFGFVNLPLGWIAIVPNIANLVLINTDSAKKWFSSP